jgi:hypothetical protein
VDHRASYLTRTLAAFILAALCSACGSVADPAGFSVVTQDKYDFLPCKDIVTQRTANTNREKELSILIAKAESSPGGFIASYTAYRSELTQVRAFIAAANRALQKNNCEQKQ